MCSCEQGDILVVVSVPRLVMVNSCYLVYASSTTISLKTSLLAHREKLVGISFMLLSCTMYVVVSQVNAIKCCVLHVVNSEFDIK